MIYPPGFESAWKAYPRSLRNAKAESFSVWKRRGLEEHGENVVAWIEACSRADDWTRDCGLYVPGMQVWLKKHDFSETPPVIARDPLRDLSEAGRKTAEAGRALLEERQRFRR